MQSKLTYCISNEEIKIQGKAKIKTKAMKTSPKNKNAEVAKDDSKCVNNKSVKEKKISKPELHSN
jgi:hypothetical protein